MSAAKTPKTKTKDQKGTETVKPAENAFAGVADVLGAGIDALFGQSDDPEFMVNLDDIEIVDQVREQMEDDEQDLIGLGESLAKYQIQAIFLRIMPAGHPKPYRLVAGERRYRAARVKGLAQLRAKARELTDEEAEDLQFAENIHRKNLTQIEEAKKIQRDLDRLGSVEAVLEKHQKSRSWLSKVLSLLNLPEQAKRLVAENVSADVEVINTVKTIEKADPEAAKELVEDLKATRGKSNAREKAQAAKEKVKPSKKPKADKKAAGGPVATPKDRSQEEPGPVSVFAGEKSDDSADNGLTGADPFAADGGEASTEDGSAASAESAPRPVAFAPAEALNKAYVNIFEFGSSPKTVLDVLSAEEREAVDAWLHSFYDAGVAVKDVGRAVIQGFRNGQFSSDGDGAFALVAFLHGADSDAKYNLLNVFGSFKE
ncbi:putative plasmid-partitioning protein ParB (plasmid) [Sterolibacterium denitrificans]|uniref:Plasmid-partitioning protein ParB n=1 Tax=Sterolibacterium denitrificans TaxID=157592 RepID=A0A7Z7HTT8_9PROT|nr:ParB/RepB/Spo0J family partition protein [Sterolibacterium denitrificans]SMB33078.1 putative plasmid-partitioning protein ParB [Sterolibacterium denitrificans]